MIRRVLYIVCLSMGLCLGYTTYLSTTIGFDQDFAHLLLAGDEVIDAQVSTDHQWRIRCDDDLPDKLATTILLFEDQYFYKHPGINPVSIVKAAWDNFEAGRTVRGGSTITMQLARILEGNQPRTYRQKVQEILLAFALELKYTKGEILHAYAQYAPFGGNAIGYCGAAMRYYNKTAHQLSWTEAATLSVLPNAPGKVYPGKAQKTLVQKRNFLLRKLLTENLIDSITYRLSVLEDLPQQSHSFPARAPHLLQLLKRRAPHQFNHQTSLDASLQREVYRLAEQYQHLYDDESDVRNIAAVVLRNDGSVAAYLANTACGSNCGADVDILQSRRSPGSTLKPFLYGLAIDQGMIAPSSLLEDTPIFYNGYSPGNFDKTYRGVVTAEEALTRSLNVPAVNLLHKYGVTPFLNDVRSLGLSTLRDDAGHYGLSLILGGSEVMPIELATAYCNLSRHAMGLRPISARFDSTIIMQEDYFPMSRGAAYHSLRMLEGVHRPDSEDGWEFFNSEQAISWKTGTSYGMRDAWSVGTNTNYTVLVWVGNADGAGRPGLTGVSKAAPIMFDIFKLLPRPLANYAPPMEMMQRTICTASGYSPTSACRERSSVLLPARAAALPMCTYHQTITVDSAGKYRVFRGCVDNVKQTTVFALPPQVDAYYSKSTGISHALPAFHKDCATDQAPFDILFPKRNAQILLPKDLDTKREPLVCKALTNEDSALYWFLDGTLVQQTVDRHEVQLKPSVGRHQLTVVSDSGAEQQVGFTIVE